MYIPKELIDSYKAAEADFFRSLDESQWRVLDHWIAGEPVSLATLAFTLADEQVPLMAAWAQTLSSMVEE
jgi:hypothetical protein